MAEEEVSNADVVLRKDWRRHIDSEQRRLHPRGSFQDSGGVDAGSTIRGKSYSPTMLRRCLRLGPLC